MLTCIQPTLGTTEGKHGQESEEGKEGKEVSQEEKEVTHSENLASDSV
jgi:hypothetical protein